MSTATSDYPEILLTGPGPTITIPAWVRKFKPKTATGARVRQLRKLPAVTVIQANEPDFIGQHGAFVRRLATTHELTPGPSKILVVFGSRGAGKSPQLLSWLRVFSRTGDVEFARNADEAAFALEGAFAKLRAIADQASPPRIAPDAARRSQGDPRRHRRPPRTRPGASPPIVSRRSSVSRSRSLRRSPARAARRCRRPPMRSRRNRRCDLWSAPPDCAPSSSRPSSASG